MSNFKSVQTDIVLAPAHNETIRFTDESGTEIQLSQADVLQYICERATPQEALFFMELCRSQRLNPFIREAFLVKFGGNPAQMITAEIVFERRANAHPDYQGMEHGVVFLDSQGNIQRREGTATYKVLGEKLIGGWCRVHRRGRMDSVAEVTLDEYNKNQNLWKTMPGVMIDKCAKSVALRAAFPAEFEGLYSEAEMNGAPTVIEVGNEMAASDVRVNMPQSAQEPEFEPESTRDDMQAEFNNIVANLASLRDKSEGDVALAVLKSKAVTATGYVLGTDMTESQMETAIGVAKGWLIKAMESQDQQEVGYEQPTYDGPEYDQMPLYEE